MEILWSPEAAFDFTAIIQYIRNDNSSAALRVARAIHEAIAQLNAFPNRGPVWTSEWNERAALIEIAVCRGVSC